MRTQRYRDHELDHDRDREIEIEGGLDRKLDREREMQRQMELIGDGPLSHMYSMITTGMQDNSPEPVSSGSSC